MESFIPTPPVTGPVGKKLKAFETVDGGGNVVESEAVTLTNGTTGAEILIATEATLEQVADSLTPEGSLQLGAETVVSNVAVMVLPANALRRGFVLQNNGEANIRVGPAGVGGATGIRLLPDAVVTASPPFLPIGELWAIAEGADSILFATEVF